MGGGSRIGSAVHLSGIHNRPQTRKRLIRGSLQRVLSFDFPVASDRSVFLEKRPINRYNNSTLNEPDEKIQIRGLVEDVVYQNRDTGYGVIEVNHIR